MLRSAPHRPRRGLAGDHLDRPSYRPTTAATLGSTVLSASQISSCTGVEVARGRRAVDRVKYGSRIDRLLSAPTPQRRSPVKEGSVVAAHSPVSAIHPSRPVSITPTTHRQRSGPRSLRPFPLVVGEIVTGSGEATETEDARRRQDCAPEHEANRSDCGTGTSVRGFSFDRELGQHSLVAVRYAVRRGDEAEEDVVAVGERRVEDCFGA